MNKFIDKVNDAKIVFGLDDGVNCSGMFVTACAGSCNGEMRNWGTSGDFNPGLSATWKCTSKPSCGLFYEPLELDSSTLFSRYEKQRAAVEERVKRDPASDRAAPGFQQRVRTR